MNLFDKLRGRIDPEASATLGEGAKDALSHLGRMLAIGREVLAASADQAKVRMPEIVDHAKAAGKSVTGSLGEVFRRR